MMLVLLPVCWYCSSFPVKVLFDLMTLLKCTNLLQDIPVILCVCELVKCRQLVIFYWVYRYVRVIIIIIVVAVVVVVIIIPLVVISFRPFPSCHAYFQDSDLLINGGLFCPFSIIIISPSLSDVR